MPNIIIIHEEQIMEISNLFADLARSLYSYGAVITAKL